MENRNYKIKSEVKGNIVLYNIYLDNKKIGIVRKNKDLVTAKFNNKIIYSTYSVGNSKSNGVNFFMRRILVIITDKLNHLNLNSFGSLEFSYELK